MVYLVRSIVLRIGSVRGSDLNCCNKPAHSCSVPQYRLRRSSGDGRNITWASVDIEILCFLMTGLNKSLPECVDFEDKAFIFNGLILGPPGPSPVSADARDQP